MEKICVEVRVRPESSSENASSLWKVEDNRISLDTPISVTSSYYFDHVFDEMSTNACVYELLTMDTIHAVVEGFNGKTFTMTGSETDPGIIRRSVRDISDREFLIRVSYMEIYNEEINDLLAVENQRLQIHEHLKRRVFVAGLSEEIVNDAEQILKLLDSGEAFKTKTNMNVHSSTSHTIFRMVIESRGKGNNSMDPIRVLVLNLVDLAGSERIAKTGAGGVRLTEGKYINKSLMILGNFINKLSENAKLKGHIPYRDSKLTRILQPALGGNAKTCIICTIAPEEYHIEESKGTLQFANRAKRITNCAQVNEILTDDALLKRQKLEIEELRMKLQGSHAEVLEQEIMRLSNQMLKYELECERLKTQLEEERRKQKEQEQEQWIKDQQLKTENINSLVSNLDFKRNQSEEFISFRKKLDESNNVNDSSDVPGTPCFKSATRSFVVARSNYSGLPDFSPMVDALGDLADEDTWAKLNKGFVPDLDKLQFTPAFRSQPIPLNTATMECSREEALQVKFNEQVVMNNKLMENISELKQEMLHMKKIPERLYEPVANCKDVCKDVIVTMKSLVAEKESPRAKLFFGATEITTSLLSTLESQFSMIMDGQKSGSGDHPSSDQWETLCVNLKNITTSLLSDAQAIDRNFLTATASQQGSFLVPIIKIRNSCTCVVNSFATILFSLEQEMAALDEKLKCELSIIKERYNDVVMDDTKESELVAADGELDLEEALHVPAGPMTRAKTKRLREAFICLIQKMDQKIIKIDRKIIYEGQIQDGNIWICISAKEITHGDWAFNVTRVELTTAKNQDETLVDRWILGEKA
ncbi:BnaC04g18590D [Brassica napus]|uniref:BnaC04g18590D protein n=1 Tax=Brassica napus TaxID=3708 RepID=A0A078GPX6_BRANA|nr:BnaC04g18590D [Brassica napus]